METVIITAGGIGKRMEATIPKQFIELSGKPILMHTLTCFHNYNPSIQLILTLPNDWISYWKELCTQFQFDVAHEIVEGGVERYDSIKNALKIASGTIIGVHDGVRPLVSTATIQRTFDAARLHKAAIPYLPIHESLRQRIEDSSHAVNRSEFVCVQTPQCFERDVLIKAYAQPYHQGITDDASLVEQSGQEIFLVLGNEENIKITTPNDLKIAQLFI